MLSIFGIAIGLICFSITCYYIHRQFQEYTVWEHSERMGVFLSVNSNNGTEEPFIPGDALQKLLDDPIAGIEKIALCEKWNNANITFVRDQGGEVPFLCSLAKINRDFPEVYSMKTLSGETARLNQGEALISETCARKVFGTENPIGKSLYFTKADNDTSLISAITIAHVIKDLPSATNMAADLYFQNYTIDTQRNYWGTTAVALLSDKVSVKNINQRLGHQITSYGENNNNFLRIQTLHQKLLHSDDLVAGILLPFIASLVLIVAMINFLKLSIQSFYLRTRELCLRKSLGSGQGGLFSLLFAEQGILIIMVILVTFSLTEFSLPYLYTILPEGTIEQIDLSEIFWQQAQYTVVLLLICLLITQIAVRRIRFLNVISGIRSNNRHKVRNFMLGIQLVVCFFFVGAGIGMMIHSKNAEMKRYKTLSDEVCARIWQIDMFTPQLKGHEQQIMSRIHALSGVEEITVIGNNGYQRLTLSDSIHRNIRLVANANNYATFMHLPIKGKNPAEDEIVICRTLKELLDRTQPTNNSSLTINNKNYRVVGVYEQIPFLTLVNEHSSPDIKYNAITSIQDETGRSFYIKCVEGQEEAVKEQILTIIREKLPDTIPFQLRSLQEENFLSYGGENVLSSLFLILSVICLLITSLGIYSAITIDTQSRQKEVAIHKINGAGPKVIIRLFGKLYLRLLVISASVTFPLLYFIFFKLNKGIASKHHFINNPLFWISILTIVSGIVLLTVGSHIWKVSRLNPAEVIKNE